MYLPITEHIAELRKTIIRILLVISISTAISFYFYREIFAFLTAPYLQISSGNEPLLLLGPLDGFAATLKICLWTGIIVASPFWLFFLLQFISPALNSSEKRYLPIFVFLSFLSLFLGALSAFYITIPLANHYLLSFGEGIGTNLWSVSNYLDYTLVLLCANALCFELGLLLLSLVWFEILPAELLISKRRHAIVAALILGALLTPPDVLTQLLVAVPLIALYEFAILISKKNNNGPSR